MALDIMRIMWWNKKPQAKTRLEELIEARAALHRQLEILQGPGAYHREQTQTDLQIAELAATLQEIETFIADEEAGDA
jgi:t-SNARE complex subunit (syntaxin)